MKLLVIISCILVAIYGMSDDYQDKFMEKMAQIAEKCVPLTGANDEDIGELLEKKSPSRKEGKCLIACFTKELGMMKNGRPDKEATIAAFESLKSDDPDLYGKFMKVLDKCSAELANDKETDECELASKSAMCSQKEAKEMGLEDPFMG